jgi:hypothetical protein
MRNSQLTRLEFDLKKETPIMSTVNSLAILCAVTVSGLLGQNTQTTHVAVEDPRPLAAAALQLEKQFEVPINYEDIPYVFPGDMVAATTRMTATQLAAKTNPNTVMMPRGGELQVDVNQPAINLNQPSNASAGLLQALSQLTTDSTAGGFPGSYTAVAEDGVFYLRPTRMQNGLGVWISVSPALDTRVTVPSGTRTVAATLKFIFAEVLQNSGQQIVLGLAPLDLLLRQSVTIDAASEPARSVIVRMFSMVAPATNPLVKSTLGYRLLCDPSPGYCAFNIHSVVQSSQATTKTLAPPSGKNPYKKNP